jgi:hypothetical protein
MKGMAMSALSPLNGFRGAMSARTWDDLPNLDPDYRI